MTAPQSNRPLLEVEDLTVEFPTRRGTLTAVDGISFHIDPGEVLGVVGESGAGKSVSGSAIIGLLDPPGRIAGGRVLLDGARIDDLPYEQLRRIRGSDIGMVFQDPLTSLNPLYTIERQLVETICTHTDLSSGAARAFLSSRRTLLRRPQPTPSDTFSHQTTCGPSRPDIAAQSNRRLRPRTRLRAVALA